MVFGRKGTSAQNLFESIDSSDSDVESSQAKIHPARGRTIDGGSSGRGRSRSRARSMAEKMASNLAYVSPLRLKPRLLAAATTKGGDREIGGQNSTGDRSPSDASEISLRDIVVLDSQNPNHNSASSFSVEAAKKEDVTPGTATRISRFWRPLSPSKKPLEERPQNNKSTASDQGDGLLAIPSLVNSENLSKHSLLERSQASKEALKPPSFRVNGAMDISRSLWHNSMPTMALDIEALQSKRQKEDGTLNSRASSLSPKKMQRRRRKEHHHNRGDLSICSGHNSSPSVALDIEGVASPNNHHQVKKADDGTFCSRTSSPQRRRKGNTENQWQNGPKQLQERSGSSCLANKQAGYRASAKPKKRASAENERDQPSSPNIRCAESKTKGQSTLTRETEEASLARVSSDPNNDRKEAVKNSDPIKRPRSRSKSSKTGARTGNRGCSDNGNNRERKSGTKESNSVTPKTPLRERRHHVGTESLSACLEQKRENKTPISTRSVATEVLRSTDSRSIRNDGGRIRSRSVGRKTPRTPRSRAVSRSLQASVTPGRSITKQRKTKSSKPHLKPNSSRYDAKTREEQDCNNSLAQLNIPALTDESGEDVSVQFFEPHLVRSQ